MSQRTTAAARQQEEIPTKHEAHRCDNRRGNGQHLKTGSAPPKNLIAAERGKLSVQACLPFQEFRSEAGNRPEQSQRQESSICSSCPRIPKLGRPTSVEQLATSSRHGHAESPGQRPHLHCRGVGDCSDVSAVLSPRPTRMGTLEQLKNYITLHCNVR